MRNALKRNPSKFILVGKIKGLAIESQKARTCLHKARSPEATSDLAIRKKIVGIDIRHHLLAYAFLRGIPYHDVERTCAGNNLPKPDFIYKIVEAHAPTYIHYDHATGEGGGSYHANLEMIKKWIAGDK